MKINRLSTFSQKNRNFSGYSRARGLSFSSGRLGFSPDWPGSPLLGSCGPGREKTRFSHALPTTASIPAGRLLTVNAVILGSLCQRGLGFALALGGLAGDNRLQLPQWSPHRPSSPPRAEGFSPKCPQVGLSWSHISQDLCGHWPCRGGCTQQKCEIRSLGPNRCGHFGEMGYGVALMRLVISELLKIVCVKMRTRLSGMGWLSG